MSRSPMSPNRGSYDSDLERMRNKVAMPYVKGKVQGAAMAQFKSIMRGIMHGKTAGLVRSRPSRKPSPRALQNAARPPLAHSRTVWEVTRWRSKTVMYNKRVRQPPPPNAPPSTLSRHATHPSPAASPPSCDLTLARAPSVGTRWIPGTRPSRCKCASRKPCGTNASAVH
jgi:hypothetical protein